MMPMVIESLIAVFLLIGLGYALKAGGVLTQTHLPAIERMTYLVLCPAVVIHNLATVRLGDLPFLQLGGALALAIVLVTLLLLVMQPALARLGIDGPSFTSVYQGAVRWNAFTGLAMAAAIYGERGLALIAVAIACIIPLLNVLSVLILSRFASGKPLQPVALLRAIVTNPFIWSCAVGLLINPFAGAIPKAAMQPLDLLAKSAIPVGLLVVGGALELRRLTRPGWAHSLALALKLIVLPLIVAVLAPAMGISGVAYGVALIVASVPTASTAYILARQMGGNAELMAEITTLQTIAAVLTMPLILSLAN